MDKLTKSVQEDPERFFQFVLNNEIIDEVDMWTMKWTLHWVLAKPQTFLQDAFAYARHTDRVDVLLAYE